MAKEMPVREVINLSKQGYNDADIIRHLREQGYSPTQINDAMNQARIKMELEKTAGIADSEEATEYGYAPAPSGEEMMPSILSQEEAVRGAEGEEAAEQYSYYAPAPAGVAETETAVEEGPAEYPPEYVPQYAPAEQAPVEESAGGYPYTYPAYESVATAPVEGMEELAEEIISEKWREFVEQVGDIGEFKRYIEARMNSVEERIKRMEMAFDKLQAAMMERVESYGRGIRSLGTEVQALEGAFSKIVEPLTSSVKELRELSEEMKTKIPKTRSLAETLEKSEGSKPRITGSAKVAKTVKKGK
ncbi:MAG: hypothetical protein K6T16_00945 [Candidatus Pacearchaeota archaeon]|nr:hypothetical protein [Candidatus Pacearchaeota archaeon]